MIKDYKVIGKDLTFIKVEIYVHIRKNENNEIRVFKDYLLMDVKNDSKPSVFNWEHNNYSCDCNRSLFFQRAGNKIDDSDPSCGDGAFSVNIYNSKNMDLIYQEFGEEHNDRI